MEREKGKEKQGGRGEQERGGRGGRKVVVGAKR